MSNELKPCPFCGGDASLIVKTFFGFPEEDIYTVACNDCKSQSCYSDDREETVKVWNTRPAEDALKAEQDALIHIHQKENAEHDSIIQTLKKQLAASYDQNNVAFLFGMDQMKSLVGEKNDEITRLKAELEELRYIVDQFFNDWYCEDGCPKQKDKDFPCYGEEENETTTKFYPGECSFYQTKCWVEYYRWEFRRMKKARGEE